MQRSVPLVSALQILHSEEGCIDTLAFDAEQVVEAAARLVALNQLGEQFVQQGRLHDLERALRLVYHLLHEALDDRHDSVVWHFLSQVAEKPVHDEIEHLVDLVRVGLQHLLAVGHKKSV